VKQNLFWAFGYNTLAIPFAMGVPYPFLGQIVSPELAAVLMATSSLSVTLNSLRIRRFVPPVRRAMATATTVAPTAVPALSVVAGTVRGRAAVRQDERERKGGR